MIRRPIVIRNESNIITLSEIKIPLRRYIMKQNLRRALAATAATLAVIAPLPMQNLTSGIIAPMTASALVSDKIEWQVADGITLYFESDRSNFSCTLTGSDITVNNATFAIPDNVSQNGRTFRVTTIGSNAFRDKKNLRAITQGAKHITSIEAGAFLGCSNLYSVSLFDGTGTDGSAATVRYIGGSAFKDCTSLKDSKFIQNAEYIASWAFWGSGLPTVYLRDVRSIGEAAFYNCTNVSSINIYGSSLRKISNFAFYNCSSAGYISLHDGVEYIGKSAFAHCSKITELSLPSTVRTIDTGAFMNCSRLKNVTTVHVDSIMDHAFFNCPSITQFKSGYRNTALGDYSLGFSYTNKLEKNASLHIEAPSGGSVQAYATINGFSFN